MKYKWKWCWLDKCYQVYKLYFVLFLQSFLSFQELQFFSESLQQLKIAQLKFNESGECVEKVSVGRLYIELHNGDKIKHFHHYIICHTRLFLTNFNYI